MIDSIVLLQSNIYKSVVQKKNHLQKCNLYIKKLKLKEKFIK